MTDNTDDEWKDIPNYPLYQITKDGRVRNTKRNRLLNPSIGKRGYWVLNMKKSDGKRHLVTLHRLLAEVFIPNPLHLPEVNHIDGNKTNYTIDNLEWVTRKENDAHARRTGLHNSDGDKPVLQIKDDKIIAEFKSASLASRLTGISRSCICHVCNGYFHNGRHHYTAGGYVWKWRNDYYDRAV